METVYVRASTPFSLDALNIQEDNDLPVHLKGGGTDNVLYRLTMALCLGGECRARLGLSFKRPARTGVRKGLVPSLGFGRELTSV